MFTPADSNVYMTIIQLKFSGPPDITAGEACSQESSPEMVHLFRTKQMNNLANIYDTLM